MIVLFFTVLQNSSSRSFRDSNLSLLANTPLERSLFIVVWITCCCDSPSHPGPLIIDPSMNNKYRSPAKLSRSLSRLLEYKKAMLEDIWNADVTIKTETNDLIWNISKCLKLTLKPKNKILEAWEFTNPQFASLPICEKLTQFQNMWKPDENSFTFFSSIHHHLRRNSSQCDNFCTEFPSPCCSELTYYLATNTWPD